VNETAGPQDQEAGVRQLLDDFKAFIMRGNVLDLAVAVVVGAAFNAVVQSFANDVLMAFVGALFGEPNFDAVTFDVGDGEVLIGRFITQLVNFLIIAFAVFMVVQTFQRLQSLRRRDVVAESPAPSDEAVLLAEIRDLLKARA
jgi:large conductance mechanosensitive channel